MSEINHFDMQNDQVAEKNPEDIIEKFNLLLAKKN